MQSPATPRFQSPDPYSRPPSRPQSRDPFTSQHKPPRPTAAATEVSFRGSPHPSQQPPCSPSVGDPLTGKPPGPPTFSRSPSMGTLQIGQQQAIGQQQVINAQQAQGQLQQPSSQPQSVTADINCRIILPSGNQDSASVRPPDGPHLPGMPSAQELPDLSACQDQSLIG